MRITPLFIKKLIGPFFYKKMGEEFYSGKLSNVGRVTLPESIAKEIKDFEFVLAPSETITSSCSVISFGDSLTINFGRTIKNTDLEKYFFEKLVDLGAEVRIETN
jgi:NRPS condensation-like uncharacterized protein